MLLLTLLTLHSAANAGSICNDGWVSPSEGQGACSWHGGVERLCGGTSQISPGVHVANPPCPRAEAWDPSAALIQARERQWELALTQARMEIDAGQITPDQLISRAREIMTEQWGSPAEREALRKRKAAIKQATDLLDGVATAVGAEHVPTWARYIQEPGICTTAAPGLILFKTRGGAIISLPKGEPAAISLEPDAHARYESIRAAAATNPDTPEGELCPNGATSTR